MSVQREGKTKRRGLRIALAVAVVLAVPALVWACPATTGTEDNPREPEPLPTRQIPEPNPASEGEPEPASEPELDPDPEPEPEPESEPTPDTASEPEPASAADPAPSPGSTSGSAGGSASTASPGGTSDPPDSPSTPAAHVHTLATREVGAGTRDIIRHVDGHTETVHHDEVWDIWTESVWLCNGTDGGGCGAVLHSQAEITAHMKETGHNGWYSSQIVHEDKLADAYDEEVWIDAYDEVVGWQAVYVLETYCTSCGEVIERSEAYAH